MLSIIEVKFLAEPSADKTLSTVMLDADRSAKKLNGSILRSTGPSVLSGLWRVLRPAKMVVKEYYLIVIWLWCCSFDCCLPCSVC